VSSVALFAPASVSRGKFGVHRSPSASVAAATLQSCRYLRSKQRGWTHRIWSPRGPVSDRHHKSGNSVRLLATLCFQGYEITARKFNTDFQGDESYSGVEGGDVTRSPWKNAVRATRGSALLLRQGQCRPHLHTARSPLGRAHSHRSTNADRPRRIASAAFHGFVRQPQAVAKIFTLGVGCPTALRPRTTHSLTPETFRPHPLQKSVRRPCEMALARTTRVPPRCFVITNCV